MTDWEWITEQIQRAMQAVDTAHEAGETLRNNVTPDTVDTFKESMQELYNHLNALNFILEHESSFSREELVDVLSQMYSGKPAAYRSSPRYEVE